MIWVSQIIEIGQGQLDSEYYIIHKSSKGHWLGITETPRFKLPSLCFIYPQQPSITFALLFSRIPSHIFLKADKKSHLWIQLWDNKKSANLIHSWLCACRIFFGLSHISVTYESPLLAIMFLSLSEEMNRKQEIGFSQTRFLTVVSVLDGRLKRTTRVSRRAVGE